MESEINLKFTLNEINTLLVGVGKLPYEHVFTLVDKIKEQAEPQINSPVNKDLPQTF
jgi:hypothetical protein